MSLRDTYDELLAKHEAFKCTYGLALSRIRDLELEVKKTDEGLSKAKTRVALLRSTLQEIREIADVPYCNDCAECKTLFDAMGGAP